jgi:opacity protein-like surface antigen
MKLITSLAAVAAVLGSLAASPAIAQPKKAGDVSIPFVNHGGIRDWRAVDDHTLYVQSQDGQWFKATTMGDCIGLDFEDRIGFDTGPIDTFDKFSRLMVRGQPCPIQSLEKVAGKPPTSKPKAHKPQ